MTSKAGGGQKKPATGNNKYGQQPASQQQKSPTGANTIKQIWFGGSRGWHNAAGHPPPFRDSLNDGDGHAQPATYAAFGSPRCGGSRAIAAVIAGGRRVMAAVAENLAVAVDSWRAAMAALWTWLKTLM